MVKFYKRRLAQPKVVLQLWSSINAVRLQKQIANADRLTKYLGREYDMKPSEVEENLANAVHDGLTISYKTVGNKGSKVGLEQEGYKVPDMSDCNERGSHDWYCFECHQPGEVVKCKDCWRVFHSDCIDYQPEDAYFYCEFCKTFKKKSKIPRRELNRLLSFTIVRLKEKTRELHRIGQKDEELKFMAFIYKDMDLNMIEEKIQNKDYSYLEEFYADTRLILHNVMLCYGEFHQMSDLCRVMIKDCMYDLDEIRLCKDCYFMSNAKPKDWFCEPCSPPHDLVYAKQRGFNFWPAKVIKVTKDGYDVRFFGGWHQRATVPKSSVKPIDTNPKQITGKRTSGNLPGFAKACEELQRHKELLERQLEKQLERKRQGITESDIDEMSDDEPLITRPASGVLDVSDLIEEDEDIVEEGVEERGTLDMEEEVEDPGEDLQLDAEDEEEEEQEEEAEAKSVKEEEEEPKPKRRRTSRIKKEDETPKTKRKRKKKGATAKDESDESENEAAVASKVVNSQAPTPEDVNLVTSSEDKVSKVTTMTSCTQTVKRINSTTKPVTKTTQTDSEVALNCQCDIKYQKVFSDFKDKVKNSHEEEKDKALKELSDRLQKDFEEDKQQAVSRAIANMQREIDRVRKQTEESICAKYMEEMKKLAQKHKEQLSSTKKKQWCYNCEQEAMYHCCWNTSYCSIKCQQEHWHKDHKRVCRRKR